MWILGHHCYIFLYSKCCHFFEILQGEWTLHTQDGCHTDPAFIWAAGCALLELLLHGCYMRSLLKSWGYLVKATFVSSACSDNQKNENGSFWGCCFLTRVLNDHPDFITRSTYPSILWCLTWFPVLCCRGEKLVLKSTFTVGIDIETLYVPTLLYYRQINTYKYQ